MKVSEVQPSQTRTSESTPSKIEQIVIDHFEPIGVSFEPVIEVYKTLTALLEAMTTLEVINGIVYPEGYFSPDFKGIDAEKAINEIRMALRDGFAGTYTTRGLSDKTYNLHLVAELYNKICEARIN